MTIAATVLLQSIDTSNTTSYASSSFTITNGRPVLLCLQSAENDPSSVPTIAASNHGSTYTWTQEDTVQMNGGVRRRITVFSTLPTSTNTDTITINYTNAQFSNSFHIVEFTGADTTDLVRQSVNAAGGLTTGLVSITLAAFGNVNNATFGFWAINGSSSLTVGSGFTGLTDQQATEAEAPTRVITEFRNDNDTGVDMTITGGTNRRYVGIALELKANLGTDLTLPTSDATALAPAPAFTVTIPMVTAEASADATPPAIPVVLTPTGILADASVLGPALLGNIVLGDPGGSSTTVVTMVAAEAAASANVPTMTMAYNIPVSTATAVGPDDPPELNFSIGMIPGVATAVGNPPTPGVVLTMVTGTATADALTGLVATISNSILLVAATAGADANPPALNVAVPMAVATASADGIVVTLNVEIPMTVAAAIAEAPAPIAGTAFPDASGEIDLRAIRRERADLEAVERETVLVESVRREQVTLNVEAL